MSDATAVIVATRTACCASSRFACALAASDRAFPEVCARFDEPGERPVAKTWASTLTFGNRRWKAERSRPSSPTSAGRCKS